MTRRLLHLVAVLGGVHVLMLVVGRFLLLEETWLLWAWFGTCAVVGGVAAARLGGLRPLRGLVGAVAFLVGWLVLGPLLDSAFPHLLPERPVILGVALAAQLLVMLPTAGVAWVWRLLVPLTVDTTVSTLVGEATPPGVGGPATVVVTLAVVWVLESGLGLGRRPRSRPVDPVSAG